MTEPKGFLLYLDDLKALEPLTFEERGRLLTHLLEYAISGNECVIEGNERFIFPIFKTRIDRDFEKYREKCERNRKNAEKRWDKAAFDSMQSDATAYDCVPNMPIKKEKEKEIKKQKEIEREIEIEIKEEDKVNAGKPATSSAYDYDLFRETYNSLCRKLPSCRTMPQKRKKAVQNFLKDFTQEQWEEICKAANESEFLTGGNDRGWKANIDFLLRPDKAVKALEGAYTRASYRDKYETDIPENQNPDSIFYGLPDDYFEGDRK